MKKTQNFHYRLVLPSIYSIPSVHFHGLIACVQAPKNMQEQFVEGEKNMIVNEDATLSVSISSPAILFY